MGGFEECGPSSIPAGNFRPILSQSDLPVERPTGSRPALQSGEGMAFGDPVPELGEGKRSEVRGQGTTLSRETLAVATQYHHAMP